MRKIAVYSILLFAGVIAFLWAPSSAEAAEKLYICGPCSREFIPMAQEIITELELEEEIRITPSSCLGPCQAKYVIKFQGTVYSYMNEETLREMLISVYSLQEKAPTE